MLKLLRNKIAGSLLLVFGSQLLGDVCLLAQQPNYLWIKHAGVNNSPTEGTAMATDPSGNVYILGKFSDQTSFGNIALEGSGIRSLFLTKYDPPGKLLWVQKARLTLIQPKLPEKTGKDMFLWPIAMLPGSCSG